MSGNSEQQKTQPVVSNNLTTTQDIENRPILPPNSVKNLSGYFETLTSAPTFTPKIFYDSIKIYNGAIYVYDFKSGSWISSSSGSFLTDAGKGASLPTASDYTDEFYYKTDTDTLYRSNGTSWIALN